MSTKQDKFVPSKLALAVHGALLAMTLGAMSAQAADATVESLTAPDKSVEAGVVHTNRSSYKFGEYNDLGRAGSHGRLEVDANFKGADNSPFWGFLRGNDLGSKTGHFEAEGGNQGQFNLQFLYDQLQHNISDTYQTIFLGVGTTALTLPSSYPAIGTRISSTSSSANALANWANIQAPNAVSGVAGGGPGYLIPSLMHNENIGTQRTKTGLGSTLQLPGGWALSASVLAEEKKGTKLTGFAFATSSTAAMFAEPINTKTETYNFGASYKGEKATLNANFAYSTFRNDINAWTAQTPFATGSVLNNQALMSSAPDNKMVQFSLGGTYRFEGLTRLSYEYTRSHMTQNDPFNCQTGATTGCLSGQNSWSIPSNSANAEVDVESAFLKLSAKPFKDLGLLASLKSDSRRNNTPVQTFKVNFADAAGAATNTIINDPISTQKLLLDLNADYTFAPRQAVKFGYQRENINRSSSGSGYAPSRIQTTANTNDFTLPTHQTTEDSWNLEYRNTSVDNLNGRIAYTLSKRSAGDYAVPTLAASSATLDATATALGNAYYSRFRDYFVADRTREKIRSVLSYEASDTLSLSLTADLNREKYDNAALRESRSGTLTVDLTYTPTDYFTITPFYTYENRKTSLTGKYITTLGSTSGGATQYYKLNGGAATACGNGVGASPASCVITNYDWEMSQADRVDTFGISSKYKGFISKKLDLTGDVLLVVSRTPVTASGPGVVVSDGNTGASAGTAINYTTLAALSFPDITSRTLQVKLTGSYDIDKAQTVRVNYLFQRLISSDWQYDAYTNPIAMQAFIGTGMTSPQYTVNAVGVSYSHKF